MAHKFKVGDIVGYKSTASGNVYNVKVVELGDRDTFLAEWIDRFYTHIPHPAKTNESGVNFYLVKRADGVEEALKTYAENSREAERLRRETDAMNQKIAEAKAAYDAVVKAYHDAAAKHSAASLKVDKSLSALNKIIRDSV